jgi:hypothetical protein
MRRRERQAARLKAHFDGRLYEVRRGREHDPVVELGRVRLTAAYLVEMGVAYPSDWEMPAVPLACRGAAIDALRSSFDAEFQLRVMDPSVRLDDIQRSVLLGVSALATSIVVSMAQAVYARETSLEDAAVFSRKPRRIGDSSVPDIDIQVMKSALHSDPQAFLQDAIERRDEALADIVKAKRRITYLTKERTSPEPKEYPEPVSLDTALSLSLVSAIRGATDDLLRPIEPVDRPRPDPARRRRLRR